MIEFDSSPPGRSGRYRRAALQSKMVLDHQRRHRRPLSPDVLLICARQVPPSHVTPEPTQLAMRNSVEVRRRSARRLMTRHFVGIVYD